jgi:hypothetical protein
VTFEHIATIQSIQRDIEYRVSVALVVKERFVIHVASRKTLS